MQTAKIRLALAKYNHTRVSNVKGKEIWMEVFKAFIKGGLNEKNFVTSDSRIFETYQKANYHENQIHLLKKMGKLGNAKRDTLMFLAFLLHIGNNRS